MKNINRPLSYVILFFIYALTFVPCYFIAVNDTHELCSLFFLFDIVATIVVFIFSLIFGNASVYDPYWSIQPMVFVTISACVHGLNLLGILVLIVIYFWGIRLTANWAYTFHGLGHQDWRYTMLKEKTKGFYPVVNFFGIHLVPTIIVCFCMMPAVNMIHSNFQFRPLCLIGIGISVSAVILQGIADFQMHRFKKNGGTGFIRVGVWKYGRHPNYLGEIAMWWGIVITWIASAQYFYPTLVMGAALNTCLFLFISIPLAEKHQAEKPGFDQYKKETRMFI